MAQSAPSKISCGSCEGESYPESYLRNIPPRHTSNHTPWCNTLCWARSFRKGKTHIYIYFTHAMPFLTFIFWGRRSESNLCPSSGYVSNFLCIWRKLLLFTHFKTKYIYTSFFVLHTYFLKYIHTKWSIYIYTWNIYLLYVFIYTHEIP